MRDSEAHGQVVTHVSVRMGRYPLHAAILAFVVWAGLKRWALAGR